MFQWNFLLCISFHLLLVPVFGLQLRVLLPTHVNRNGMPILHMTTGSPWTDQLDVYPTPELDALQVVTLCMDTLQTKTSNEALEVCFEFSSDRCRAAVGGTLEQFVRYADNPVFGTLVNCDGYEIISVGPIIPGSSNGLGSRRGEMQTVLVEITEGISLKTVRKEAEQRARKRPTVEERLRQREMQSRQSSEEDEYEDIVLEKVDDGKRRFLWTLMKELRPPRQNCWLVHEVLFTKNAIHQTY